MSSDPQITLTTKDYTILEVMLDRCLGTDDPLYRPLRHKLDAATVMLRDDIPDDAVTMNSRVAYRIDDEPVETRILIHDEVRGLVGMTLPLTSQRGLAMLGLRAGQSVVLEMPSGVKESLTVLEVLYQPEAARNRMRRTDAGVVGDGKRAGAAFLRIVHSADRIEAGDDFDPSGPSAA
ncbi:GreA/GreB family elongation factor [Aquamicrobium sp. LC103]|uniref:GreA/GreB family elongation factor n=1 Tax=Aquamicrobium sp. LC103 TaxID=1120658 RepID=UPI00063EB509|nr:GreA/GreB family elongation factor [Aquamicrobium sp. LC103]TKT80241.1 nucleoside-diphosphate kinase [Aquamicrobium sp. LC103]